MFLLRFSGSFSIGTLPLTFLGEFKNSLLLNCLLWQIGLSIIELFLELSNDLNGSICGTGSFECLSESRSLAEKDFLWEAFFIILRRSRKVLMLKLEFLRVLYG